MESGFWQILWVVCGIATLVACLPAGRSRRWMYVGRAAVGVLFLFGGALLHVINLLTDVDYTDFADPAHFAWVTDTWRSVVGPNQVLFIGLLVVFEATVGALILSGGRRTQVGYFGVIGFYLALWLFGWMEAIWCIVMLPAMFLLLRAERQAERALTSTPQVEEKLPVGVDV